MTLDEIIIHYPDADFIRFLGFDDAVIGIDPYKMTLIYSMRRCLEILIERDEMTPDQASEYFDFNVAGTMLGEETPIWLDDLDDE